MCNGKANMNQTYLVRNVFFPLIFPLDLFPRSILTLLD